ncbi:unnamed protein product [Paramecium sonneborni]|uniref:Uncharacterized protein n=1 Tax=Paramecium sonneborni TaxID=65129 RepID=A0A8S1LKX8_9CILI|nr:unnamed protein product [Paramecium sonneborni]
MLSKNNYFLNEYILSHSNLKLYIFHLIMKECTHNLMDYIYINHKHFYKYLHQLKEIRDNYNWIIKQANIYYSQNNILQFENIQCNLSLQFHNQIVIFTESNNQEFLNCKCKHQLKLKCIPQN